MFIIEGGDCLGKTTLAKGVVEYVRTSLTKPACYCHMSRPNEMTFDFLWDYKKLMAPCLVYDRFHLGGLAYHEDKFTANSLSLIEGMVMSRGAFIVIIYCSDHRWYEKRLENDSRGNLLDVPAMCEANIRFTQMVKDKSVRFDVSFDLKPKPSEFEVYPVPEQYKEWAHDWQMRLEAYYSEKR